MSWLVVYEIWLWSVRLVMVGVILRRRLDPTVALAWLCVIFPVPTVGLVIYLLVGHVWLGRKRVRLHRELIGSATGRARPTTDDAVVDPDILGPVGEHVCRQAMHVSSMQLLRGNDVELIPIPATMIERLVQDIDAAQKHVHLLYYIFADDDAGRAVSAAMIRAVQRGVAVRLLVDSSASWRFFRRSPLIGELCEAGVTAQECLPVARFRRPLARFDVRNHRKLAVIDSAIAYSGSQNIIFEGGSRYGRRWADLTGRFTGPVVAQLQAVFIEDWNFGMEPGAGLDADALLPPIKPTGDVLAQVVPTGPSETHRESLPRVLLSALNNAEKQIIITTPYLVPDEPTMLALALAASRGVEISIVVPGKGDHLLVSMAGGYYYERLLEEGAKIYLHQPGMLHSKTLTVDDGFAVMGSANMDVRSFYLNFELNVLMYGQHITQRLRAIQMQYMAESTPLDLAAWRQRPAWRRYSQAAAALFSPLL